MGAGEWIWGSEQFQPCRLALRTLRRTPASEALC